MGILDAFWDSRGAITPDAFSRFCSATVPLLRMKKRTFTSDESFEAIAEVIHYGPSDIVNAQPIWDIADDAGKVVASGTFPDVLIPRAERVLLGSIQQALSGVKHAAKLHVTVALAGTDIANDWDIWVYPKHDVAPFSNVIVAKTLNADVVSTLERGGNVLLLPDPGCLKQSIPGRFLPVFWSPVWFKHQDVTMSILCDPKHPVFLEFPTDFHTNWQWYDLLGNSTTMNLDDLPVDFRPVVQVIDNFTTNRRLGNMIEAKVGKGRLLMCSIDLERNLDARPAARQLKYSLLKYMQSGAFDPENELDVSEIGKMFKAPALLSHTKVTVDSFDDDI